MKLLRILPMLALLIVAGCSNSGGGDTAQGTTNTSTTGTTGSSNTKPFSVALITPGPVSDAGWSAMAYDGLQAIKQELNAQVINQEAAGTQIKDVMRQYGQAHYDLVIGHGYEYNAPAFEVAKDFPDTVFVSSSGGKTAPNVGAFRFYLEQSFYLCGLMAGAMTKTGKAAMIGGPDVQSIRSTFKGFRAGFMAARPDGTVIEIFTGKEDDIAAAKQATLTAIGQGADFVIHQTNAAAQGVFDACKEKGVWAFGSNLNQNNNPSGVVIASGTIVAKPAFLDLAKRVRDHSYKGEITLMGMEKGAIDFVLNPALQSKVPADVQKKLTDAEAKIKSGQLQVPMDKF